MKLIKFVLVFILLLTFIPKIQAQNLQLNKNPCLYDGKIEPLSGVTRNTYIASVYYYDPDGKRPIRIQVYVNDVGYTMKRVSGRPNIGIYKVKLTLPYGKHSYYFYAEDDDGEACRFPRYGNINGPTVNARKPFVKPAILSKGGLLANYGNDSKVFTYTVNFEDPNDKAPKKIFVVIDGINYSMQLHKGNPWCGTYLTQTELSAGKHAFYFKAIDAMGNCISLPEHGFIRGPEVSETRNSNPALIDAKLEPEIGYTSQSYSYRVNYIDKDFDPPSIIQIIIDEKPFNLKLKKGNKYNGVYYYNTNHYIGNYHNYYFYCEDGRGGSCRFPETGYFYGPVVVK